MSRIQSCLATDRRSLEVGVHRTPWWTIWSLWSEQGLWQIHWQPPRLSQRTSAGGDAWAQQLDAALKDYFSGDGDAMRSLPVDPTGWTPFFAEVYAACREIPLGQTMGYGQLAAAVGRPRAVRAVGQAMARNRVPLVIPCHRVVGAAGSLGGFSAPGGVATKRRLLQLEQTAGQAL